MVFDHNCAVKVILAHRFLYVLESGTSVPDLSLVQKVTLNNLKLLFGQSVQKPLKF